MRRPMQFLLGSLLGLFPAGTPVRTTATGSIAGTVRNTQGNPIPGVSVSPRTGPRTVITDAKGNYRLDSVAVGWVRVTARAIGYASVTDSVLVSEGNVSRLDFKLVGSLNRLEEIVT